MKPSGFQDLCLEFILHFSDNTDRAATQGDGIGHPISISFEPVYDDTLEEMGNMAEILHSLHWTVVRLSSVVMRPPN